MVNDYTRIENAIKYLKENFQHQPELIDVAQSVHMSPIYFQKVFKEWAGVSPKKFLQYISLNHAKKLLADKATLAEAAYETGLSGTGRLHDLFISIEAMTPGEYKNEGEGLTIEYSFSQSPFGRMLVASTPKGVCDLFFIENEQNAYDQLSFKWKQASLINKANEQHNAVQKFFNNDWTNLHKIKLHLKGTPFQLKVWEALLKVPKGSLTTYNQVAHSIQNTLAVRAVGTAIGQNPVAFLIPCHRVIKANGIIGNYHWGETRKTAIIGWESATIYGP